MLFGGEMSANDDFVYFLFPDTKKWERMNRAPENRIGAACARDRNKVYIFGGKSVCIFMKIINILS